MVLYEITRLIGRTTYQLLLQGMRFTKGRYYHEKCSRDLECQWDKEQGEAMRREGGEPTLT